MDYTRLTLTSPLFRYPICHLGRSREAAKGRDLLRTGGGKRIPDESAARLSGDDSSAVAKLQPSLLESVVEPGVYLATRQRPLAFHHRGIDQPTVREPSGRELQLAKRPPGLAANCSADLALIRPGASQAGRPRTQLKSSP